MRMQKKLAGINIPHMVTCCRKVSSTVTKFTMNEDIGEEKKQEY